MTPSPGNDASNRLVDRSAAIVPILTAWQRKRIDCPKIYTTCTHLPRYPSTTVFTSVATQVKKPHQQPSCAPRKFHPSNVLGGTLYKSIQHNARLYFLHGTGTLATTTIYYSLLLRQCAQNIISMNHISSLSSKPANYLSKYVRLVTNKTLFHHHRHPFFVFVFVCLFVCLFFTLYRIAFRSVTKLAKTITDRPSVTFGRLTSERFLE